MKVDRVVWAFSRRNFTFLDRMQEFSNELMKLEDHPDRERILRMMDFAKQKPFFAHIICDAIWARLMDPKLPTSYKRPIFYLIDAIIVNAKGDFITFTREYLEQYYPTVLEVVNSCAFFFHFCSNLCTSLMYTKLSFYFFASSYLKLTERS